MTRVIRQPSRRVRGAALVLVLWFVAALSVIALSLGGLSRSDVRGASLQVSSARAAAIGDAGIQLALLEMDRDPQFIENGGWAELTFDAHSIEVAVQPDTGFVNINTAPVELLRELLVSAGELDLERADAVARSMDAWRGGDASGDLAAAYEASGAAFRPRGGRFESAEDLLQVLGVDYDLYARIRDLVTPYGAGSGLDDRYASLAVLRVLAGGREGLAERIFEDRRAGEVGVDTTLLDQKHVARGAGTHFKVSATFELGGIRFVRSRWMTRAGGGTSNLPWTTLAVETRMQGVAPPVDSEPSEAR